MNVSIRRGAMAYLLLFLDVDFNISQFTIPLLPNVLGWYFLLKVIMDLQSYQPSLELLGTPCKVLMIFSLTQFVPDLLPQWGTISAVAGLVQILLTLYFHFQFLTDIGTLVLEHGVDNKPLYRCRTVLTITCTLTQMMRLWPSAWLYVPVLLVGVGAAILTATQLFKCAKAVDETKSSFDAII